MISQPHIHQCSKAEIKQIKAELKAERKAKRRIEKRYKNEMKRERLKGNLRLHEIEKEKEKLERAGHDETAPFCTCKYCMKDIDFLEWCKQQTIYEQNSWVSVSIREEISTDTQCPICNETMPKWNNQCDACGHVN